LNIFSAPPLGDAPHFDRSSAPKHTRRHGGEYQRVDVVGLTLAAPAPTNEDQLLAVDEALDKVCPRAIRFKRWLSCDICRADKRRSFQVLGISGFHSKKLLELFRAWLLNEIERIKE